MIRKGIIVTRDGFRCLGGAGSGNFGHAGIPGQRGGSAPGGGGVSSGVLSGVSKGFAKMHGNSKTEFGMVLSPDGEVKIKLVGDEEKITIPKGTDVSGAHLIHNHPNERYPGLSPADVSVAIQRDMASITATGTTGDFIRLDRPDDGWPDISKDDVMNTFNYNFSELGGETFKPADVEERSAFMSELSKKSIERMGLKYTYG